jgi:hypothetical protein
MIEFIREGRGGSFRYIEPAGEHVFDWEFGTGRIVVIIYVPSPAQWDTEIPWAVGRRDETLTQMATELCGRRCLGCGIEIQDRWVNLTESSVLSTITAFARAIADRFRRRSSGARGA